MAANFKDVTVVMVPFPLYGHISPLFSLSRLISLYDIPVHFAALGEQNHELKLRLKDCKVDELPNIHFRDLYVKKESERDEEAYLALRLLGEPLSELCHELCHELSSTCKRLVLIHDLFMLDTVRTVHDKLPTNVEMYIFDAIPAFTVHSWIQQVTKKDNPDDLFLQLEAHIPSMESCLRPGSEVFITWRQECLSSSQYGGEILNTCRDMEGPYLDALAKQSENKPVWGLGPLNPPPVSQDKKNTSHKCIEWLDKQPKHSVILVSFGTAVTFSPEQVYELAIGLERCEHKFIWVLRSRDKRLNESTTNTTPDHIKLPTGFEDRVAERGIVARDWVPQLEILAHPSTGGYLFHSGWGSFLESVTMGVPMATWPLHADNPYNDVLITKVLKVGLAMQDWAHRDELVTSDTIANALKTLMNSPEGEEMRQRVVELSKTIQMSSTTHGGSTQKQMDSFIAHITRREP